MSAAASSLLHFAPAVVGDSAALVNLVNAAYRPAPGEGGWTHESALVSGQRISPAQLADILRRDDTRLITGRLQDEVVACVLVESDGGDAHIGMLAVRPDLQGSGAGKQLLQFAERYAREHLAATRYVMRVVEGRDELLAFYERRGYRRSGELADYPCEAGVGRPHRADLRIITLEKMVNAGVAAD